MENPTVRSLLREGAARLLQADLANYALDAELLLAFAIGRDRVYLMTHAETAVDHAVEKAYRELIAKRVAGIAMQYLRGVQEFWGREFVVNAAVLIPRPETELIIEEALGWIQRAGAKPGAGGRFRIADLGTGSGCIGVTLAAEVAEAEVWATDISEEALEVARLNAGRLAVAERVHFRKGDFCQPLLDELGDQTFDLVTSNPPYGGTEESDLFEAEVLRNEPRIALFAGRRGTEAMEKLLPGVGRILRSGGLFLMEIGSGQAKRVEEMLDNRWENSDIVKDLQGIPRCLRCFRRP